MSQIYARGVAMINKIQEFSMRTLNSITNLEKNAEIDFILFAVTKLNRINYVDVYSCVKLYGICSIIAGLFDIFEVTKSGQYVYRPLRIDTDF